MEFELSTEQKMIQDSARRMVERDIQPILDKHDPNKSLPKAAMLEAFSHLKNMGLMAPRLSEADGGSGMSMLNYGLVYEQLPPFLAIAVMGHECTIARIFAEATPEQKELFLPDLFEGKKITGTATTEPGVGSNPREVTTRVVEDGNELVINGRKMWCSNASIAGIINVTCADGQDDRGSNLRRVVVEADNPNMEVTEIETMGLKMGHLSEIVFEDCRVPKVNTFGSAGDAARLLTITWNGNRPLCGLAATHLAQKALDKAKVYAGERTQFGKAIGGHQLVQKLLADIETNIVTSRLLCYYALDALDGGDHTNAISAMAKRYATTACEQAVSWAMHVHGAMGIAEETGLEQLYRDVRMLPIPDATNEILTLIQGRELTGTAAFR